MIRIENENFKKTEKQKTQNKIKELDLEYTLAYNMKKITNDQET